MKIALISTPFFGVGNRDGYGGLEIVVSDLWSGLVDRGHKVVCFSPDPTIVPKGGFHKSTGPAHNTVDVDWVALERGMNDIYDKYLEEFDIVHGHNWFGFEYKSKAKNPELKVCHTHHGHLSPDWWCKEAPPFKLNFIGISNWMAERYSGGYGGQMCKIPAQAAYNGVDLDAYPYVKDKGDRLLFLGRIDPIKAPHIAVDVAKRTTHGIDIVGGTSFVSDLQYVEQIKSQCELPAHFVGEVNHSYKLSYLQNAKALILPSQFGEPFGLVCVEALACGTPVIALRDGALGELITEDVGFICDSMDEMVSAVTKIDTISPSACRKRAEFFSKERCAERYEHLFKMILEGAEW